MNKFIKRAKSYFSTPHGVAFIFATIATMHLAYAAYAKGLTFGVVVLTSVAICGLMLISVPYNVMRDFLAKRFTRIKTLRILGWPMSVFHADSKAFSFLALVTILTVLAMLASGAFTAAVVVLVIAVSFTVTMLGYISVNEDAWRDDFNALCNFCVLVRDKTLKADWHVNHDTPERFKLSTLNKILKSYCTHAESIAPNHKVYKALELDFIKVEWLWRKVGGNDKTVKEVLRADEFIARVVISCYTNKNIGNISPTMTYVTDGKSKVYHCADEYRHWGYDEVVDGIKLTKFVLDLIPEHF